MGQNPMTQKAPVKRRFGGDSSDENEDSDDSNEMKPSANVKPLPSIGGKPLPQIGNMPPRK